MVPQLVFLSNCFISIELQWLALPLQLLPRYKSLWQFSLCQEIGSTWRQIHPDCRRRQQLWAVCCREMGVPGLLALHWCSVRTALATDLPSWLLLGWRGHKSLQMTFQCTLPKAVFLLFSESRRRLLPGKLERPCRLPEWGDDPPHTS